MASQTFDGRVCEYELHPYHLLAYHGNWYLMAWNVEKERVATFALSRFRRVQETRERFTRPTDFSPESYARQSFGIVGGEEPIKVRLLFEPKLAVYITERQWHPSQEFRQQDNSRPAGGFRQATGEHGLQGTYVRTNKEDRHYETLKNKNA